MIVGEKVDERRRVGRGTSERGCHDVDKLALSTMESMYGGSKASPEYSECTAGWVGW